MLNIILKIFFLIFYIYLIFLAVILHKENKKKSKINANKEVIELNFGQQIEDNILIEVDISGSKGILGPVILTKGIEEVLPYKTSNCCFIPSNDISPIFSKNKTNYFYLPNPRMPESLYDEWVRINETKKIIMGPMYAPTKYFEFPNNNIWSERRYNEVLKSIKGFCVHSERVRDHLANRSNTTNIINKYIISRACTNLKPQNVKPFCERNIDIIFYEKYLDLNHEKQGKELYQLLSNTTKVIERIQYFHYNQDRLKYLANNAKFIIYFSFYDTGAIGLKEIQNHGVISFVLQKELAIFNESNFYIPELDTENQINKAFQIIMETIERFMNINPDTELIARKNQEYNNCRKALDDICFSL